MLTKLMFFLNLNFKFKLKVKLNLNLKVCQKKLTKFINKIIPWYLTFKRGWLNLIKHFLTGSSTSLSSS